MYRVFRKKKRTPDNLRCFAPAVNQFWTSSLMRTKTWFAVAVLVPKVLLFRSSQMDQNVSSTTELHLLAISLLA